MANLLAKFRIDYSDVIVIPDVAKKAAESSRMEFDQLIEDFKAKSQDEVDKDNDGKSYFLYLCMFFVPSSFILVGCRRVTIISIFLTSQLLFNNFGEQNLCFL